MYDDRQGKPRDNQRQDGSAAGGDDELDRLPPPAFPPGARAKNVRKNHRPAANQGDNEADVFPDDAFISPDDPIVRDSRFDSGRVHFARRATPSSRRGGNRPRRRGRDRDR